MSLATFAQYVDAKPHAVVSVYKNNVAVVAGHMYDRWVATPFPGVTPTTAVSLDYSTAGAMREAPTGLATWVKSVVASGSGGGVFLVYDRLSHQGGLSAAVTTAQTTNLPTAALTRYTSGEGVMAGVTVYSLIGTTSTTFTVSYTNSAGVSGRTSQPATIGNTGWRAPQTFLPIPLQVGDTGIRSIASITLAGSTGTAGNIGISLWKPLLAVPTGLICRNTHLDVVRHMGAVFESIPQDAALALMFCALSEDGTNATSFSAELIKQV